MRSSASTPALRQSERIGTSKSDGNSSLPSLVSQRRQPRSVAYEKRRSKRVLKGEEVVHYFARERRVFEPGVKFMPLMRDGQLGEFEAYALRRAPIAGRYTHLMSASSLIKLEPPPAEVTDLEQWTWEATAFRALRSSFKLFRHARELRCLARWRKMTRISRQRKLRDKLAKKLFIGRESFTAALHEVAACAARIRDVWLLDLSQGVCSLPQRPHASEDLPLEFSYLCPVGRVKRKAREALAAGAQAKQERVLQVSELFGAGSAEGRYARSSRESSKTAPKQQGAMPFPYEQQPKLIHAVTLSSFEEAQETQLKWALTEITGAIDRAADALQQARQAIHALVEHDDAACAAREEQRLDSLVPGTIDARAAFRKNLPMTQARAEARRRRQLRQRQREERAEFGTFVLLTDAIIVEALVTSARTAAHVLLRRLKYARDSHQGMWEVTVSFDDTIDIFEELDEDESEPTSRGLCEGGVPALQEDGAAVMSLLLTAEGAEETHMRRHSSSDDLSTADTESTSTERRKASLGSTAVSLRAAAALYARNDEEWTDKSGGVSGAQVEASIALLENIADDVAAANRREAEAAVRVRLAGGTHFTPSLDEVSEAAAHILHEAVVGLENRPRIREMWPFVDDIAVSKAAAIAEAKALEASPFDETRVREERLKAAEAEQAQCDERLRLKEAKRRARERLGTQATTEATAEMNTPQISVDVYHQQHGRSLPATGDNNVQGRLVDLQEEDEDVGSSMCSSTFLQREEELDVEEVTPRAKEAEEEENSSDNDKPETIATVRRRSIRRQSNAVNVEKHLGTLDRCDCVYSLVTIDDSYQSTLLEIGVEISASFERGDVYSGVLDPIRSLHDIDARTRRGAVVTSGIARNDDELCKLADASASDPRAWRSLAVRAARDTVLLSRDISRLKRWRTELNRALPRGSCGAIECITRPLRQRLGFACVARRKMIRQDARRAARLHARSARGAATAARRLLEQYPDSFRNFATHAATVVSVRSFVWTVLDLLAVGAQNIVGLLKHEVLNSDFEIAISDRQVLGEQQQLQTVVPQPDAYEQEEMDEQQINNEERSRTSIDVAKEVANAMEIETVGHISALRDEAARRESAVATYMIWRDSQLPLVLKEFDAELTRCAKQASTLATALAEMAASNDEQFKEPATVLESLEGSSKRALDDLERSHCQLVELRGLLEFVRHGDEAPLRLASETTFTADTRASRVFFTRAFTLWQMVTRWTEMHVRWLSQPLVALDAAELDAESLRFASESQKLLARLNAPPHADTLVYFSADLGDETIKISGSPQLEAHHGSAAETLVKETREFRALAPIAVDLRNPSLKSRHWTKIGTQVMADQTATLTLDPTITSLGELVEFGIKNHGDYIHHVSTASSAEAKLEAAIVELEGAWDLMCLPVVEVAGGRDVSKIMGHEDTMSESQPDYRSSCGTSIRSDDSKIGERERFELGPLDDVVALINEHREFLRNAALGEHGAALRPLIAAWRARLDMLSETVQTAEELSRLIRSLESLLGDLKVRDQLAHARMRFANISGKWKSLLPYWHKCPKPMLLVTAPGGEHSRGDSLEMSRLDNRPCDEVAASLPPAPCDDQLVSWKQDLAVLDELRRELNEHVAQKRDAFPRFFFLSDRVLLKTLSELQSSSARRTGNVLGSVARVLPSLFNAVAEVEGELDSEGVDMLQSAPTVQRIAILVDAVGERLVLDSPVPIVGPPEGWLLHLEKEIVETLRTAFVAAIKQRSRARGGKRLLALAAELTIIKSEDADAEDIPLQAALLAERLVWTAEVGKALAATVRPGGTDGAMLRIARDCATVAAEYAAELRHRRFSGVAHNGQAEPAVCAKKEALVVLAIHHRDTATAIASAAQHLTSLDDWTWQSQLRFYVVGNPEARRRATPLLRGKTRIEEAVVSSLSTNSAETPHLMRGISDLGVVARQVNAVLPIGAEYLGCGTRVVVTPLGGRCALALATVMDSLQGIALVGPRGVGKREIVKGLAATFYFQCVERCCADFGLKAEATVASLGRVFAGIASTGAWFILALSDRREPRVLQTLAAYMHTLQVAVATRSPTVYFPGGVTVPLKPFARAESPKNEEYHQHAHHAGMPLIAITATYEVPSWRPVFVPVPEVVAVARAELVVRGFEITTAVRTSNALAVILRLAVDARLGGGTDLEVHARWSLRTVRSVVCDATERLHVIRNGKQWGTSIVAVKCVAGLGLDDDDDDERKPPTPEDFAIVEAQEARALRAAALAIMMLPLVDRADCDLLRDIVSASLPASDKTADDGLDQKTCRVTSGAFVTVCGGEPSFQQLEAALALDDALVVSAGVALVGPAGAGKSTILRAVCSARAQATESVDADVHFVVAASLTLADVFGSADDACGAGIIHRFISCARHHLRNTADDVVHEQWIVFDGLTEAHLACEMFVVLFDRAEGMCASMSASDIRFVVETDSFAAASPALISRLGVISLPPFRESRPLREGPSPAAMRALAWLQLSQLEQALCEFGLDEVVDNLRGFFEDPACPLDTALAVARRVDCQTYFDPADLDMEPQLYLEDNDARRVSAMCSLLAALLDPSGKDEDADPPDEIGVTCAVAWAIAWGVLGHAIAVEDVQKWLKARFRELAGDDPQIEAACAGLVPGREIDDNIPWQSYSNDFLYVPTPRDESALFTLSLLAKPFGAGLPPIGGVALIESSSRGVGATTIAREFAAREANNGRLYPLEVPIVTTSTAHDVAMPLRRRLVFQSRKKKKQKRLRTLERVAHLAPPDASRRVLLIVDDVALPQRTDCTVNEFLRSLADHRSWLALKDLQQKRVHASAPPVCLRPHGVAILGVTSAATIPCRARRHFASVPVAPASPDDLRTVFRAMCGDAKHKQGFNHIMEMVVAGCSLRAAVRVARGLELGRDLSLSRVAAHELFQEFGGNRVEESLLVVNGHHYVDSSQSVEAQVGPSLESLNAGLAETRQPPSGVVLSPATGHARHVALAARAMALDAPLVLVGPQGIGRRSCVQLAAHLVGVSQVFHAPPPPISLNGDMIYMPTEDGQLDSTRCTAPPDGDAGWLETLRKASMAATTNGAVLVIADSAWAHSPLTARRLDDLKTVLATGYVARALRPEDIQKLVTDFEDDSKLKTREDQTYAALLTYGARVRHGLRLVVCTTTLEPAEPASRLALKAFIPLAVVDTFDEWGVEAFAAVGERFLGSLQEDHAPLVAWLARLEDDSRSGKAGDKHGGVGLHRAMAAATVVRQVLPVECRPALARMCAEIHVTAGASLYAYRALLVATTHAAVWRGRMLTSATRQIDFAIGKVAESRRLTAQLGIRLETAKVRANAAYQGSIAISGVVKHAGVPIKEASERHEAAVREIELTGDALDKARRAYRGALGETLGQYDDALKRLFSAFADNTNDALDWSSSTNTVVRPIKLVLEGLSILLQDKKPSWEQGYARYTGERDATDQLVKWAIAAADAAAGTTSSDQPPEAIRKRWKDIVTAAEAVMSDPSAAPATMKRVGSQGLNLGYPVATWVQAAIDLFRATMMQQAVAKWRLYLKAKVADDMAREKLLLAADAALAAKTVQAAAKELSNLMKTLVGENDNEINAIQAKQRVSCERFMELETTFNRWDARRASLAADHARLSNVAAAAAAAATYATALNMREDFLRAVARLTCVDIEWHWDVEPSTNRATYVALPRAAPALCDALSEDEACDFGGCGEGGLAYRAWNARGILPGGVCGDFALAATAAATERLRITLFADASGDGARWLLGAYDRKKLWTSASSSLVRVYLNEEGHAYMALPLLKARKPESRRRRVSSRRAAAQRSEMPKLETQVAPVVSALHAALTIGAAVVLVELPDAFFASPAAFRAFFEPLEPLLRARIDRELAATTDPPLSRVLKNHFGTSDIVNDPEQDCSRSRLVLRAAVPAETIREVSQGSSVAAALSLVETASNVATRLVEGALEALPPVEPPYGGLVAAERRFTEGALLATIAAREQDDALLELAARQDPGAIFVLPDNETGESNTPPLLAAARLRFGLERKAAAAVSDLAKTINALDAARRDLVPSAQATADVVDTCPLSSHVARFAAVVRHACKSCDGLTRPEFDPCEAALAAWLLERPSLSAEQVLPQALATALRTSQRTHGAFREELLCHPPHLAKELEAELPTELRGLSVVASDASWQAALDDAPETWLFATERAPAAVRAFFHALHPAVKLMVARVLRPERFVSVARALVAAVLGQEVVDDRIFLVQPVDQWPPVAPDSRFAPRYVAEKQRGTAAFAVAVLKHAAEAAGPAAPVVVRCVGGTGPPLVAVLETAARQMQWLRQPNVVDVSVGFPSAEANDEACAAILAAAFETGDWVVVRAARSCWMPTLLAQLDVADVVAATTKHPLIPSHRLFVVADQVSFDIVSRCGATVVLEAPSTPRARLAVSLADDGGVFAPSIFPQLLDVEQRAFYAQALLRALAAGREDLAPSALVTWCGFAATESEPSPGASILSDELVFARACRRAHLVLFQSQEPNLASPQLARHAPNIAALSALGKRALDAAQTAGTSPSWLTAPSYRDVNAVKDYVCGLPNYDDDNDDANGLVARAIPVSQSPAEAEKHRPSVVVDRIAEVSARLSEVSARLAEACRATGWSAALWRQELEYLGHAYAAGDLVSEAQHEVLVATWPRHGGFPEKGLPLARLARPERFFVALRLAAGGSLGSFACALHEPAHAGAVRICGLHLGGAGALGESGFLDEMEPQDAAGRDLLALWVWVDEECSVPPASTVDDLGAMLLERPIFVPPSNTTSSPAASKSTTYECPLYRDTSRADLLAMLRLPTHRSPDHWALRGCALFLDGAA